MSAVCDNTTNNYKITYTFYKKKHLEIFEKIYFVLEQINRQINSYDQKTFIFNNKNAMKINKYSKTNILKIFEEDFNKSELTSYMKIFIFIINKIEKNDSYSFGLIESIINPYEKVFIYLYINMWINKNNNLNELYETLNKNKFFNEIKDYLQNINQNLTINS